jgi:dihydroflavonol-4-reductase
MQAQILITGATGFIGRHLTRQLAAQGESVRILVRNTKKAHNLFGLDVESSEGDVTQPESLARACKGIQTVYHVAGIYRFGLRHCHELWETNVVGTENMLSSASTAGVAKVVHISSASLLTKDANTPDRFMTENDFPSSVPRFSAYQRSKWFSERCVLKWVERGLPVSIASVGCPLGGEDETPTPTGQMVCDFLRKQFPFYCHTGLNFVNVQDFCAGLQCVAEKGEPGERYLFGHQNLFLKQFLDLLATETGIAAPKHSLPHSLIFLAGCGGEVFDFFTHRPTARVCLETTWQSRYFQFFESTKAREKLNWQPTHSVMDGMREAVNWFQSQLVSA